MQAHLGPLRASLVAAVCLEEVLAICTKCLQMDGQTDDGCRVMVLAQFGMS